MPGATRTWHSSTKGDAGMADDSGLDTRGSGGLKAEQGSLSADLVVDAALALPMTARSIISTPPRPQNLSQARLLQWTPKTHYI